MLHLIPKIVSAIAESPAFAGKAVATGMVVVTLTAMTFQLTPDAGELQSRIMSAGPTQEELQQRQAALDAKAELAKGISQDASGKKSAAPGSAAEAAVTSCQATLKADKSESFLNDFENSFRGILPGAGNMLIERSATVQERKNKLIFEVIKRYAGLKYCIPADSFIGTLGHEHENDFSSDLDVYLASTSALKEGTYLGASTEASDISSDLEQTRTYLDGIVEQAIKAAIDMDRWTEQRLSNLTAATANDLTDQITKLSYIDNHLQNENNESRNRIGLITDDLREIEKVEINKVPQAATTLMQAQQNDQGDVLDKVHEDVHHLATLSKGGHPDSPIPAPSTSKTNAVTGVSDAVKSLRDLQNFAPKNYGKKYDGDALAIEQYNGETTRQQPMAKTSLQPIVDLANQYLSDKKTYTYGLLNLVDGPARQYFLANKIQKEFFLYVAATLGLDPFLPLNSRVEPGGFRKLAEQITAPTSEADIKEDLCKSMDGEAEGDCFAK